MAFITQATPNGESKGKSNKRRSVESIGKKNIEKIKIIRVLENTLIILTFF